MSGIWFGACYLVLVAGIVTAAGSIVAVGLWVLYRRQGGRGGLFAWIRGI